MYDDTKINQENTPDYYESPFNNYLMSGEIILWEGKHNKGGKIFSSNSSSPLFALFFLGFSIFWTFGAMTSGGFFGFLGVPFIITGLALAKKSLLPKNMYYAITNMRVMVYDGKQFKADMLSNVVNMSVQKGLNDIGNVTFDIAGLNNYIRNSTETFSSSPSGFYGVKDPEKVFTILSCAVADYVTNK